MKVTRSLVLVALLALTCSVAMADGTDPVFKLSGGGGSQVLTTFTFSFTVNPANEVSCNDGDVCVSLDFINFTHTTISELDLNPPSGTGFLFSCLPGADDIYFDTCSPQTGMPFPTPIRFFGVTTHPGILSAGSVTCGNADDALGPDNDADDTNCTADNGSKSDFLINVDLGAPGAITSPFTMGGVLVPAPEPGTLVLVLAAGLGFVALKRSGFAV